MSLYVDKKYMMLLKPKLDRFSQKGEYLWNFRCCICGDSHKNSYKARGYVYRRTNGLFFTCHNCNVSLSLGKLIKEVDINLYNEYIMETFANSTVKSPDPKPIPTENLRERFAAPKTTIKLPTIESLPHGHFAKTYLQSRKIPSELLKEFYYAADFKEFISELIPDYDKNLYENEKRIVIPFYDEKNNLLGVQGRAIGESSVRYISVKLNDAARKLYGLNKVDLTKPIKVVEGPIDSIFLYNSIATMDAALYKIIPLLGSYDYTFIYDNEPRNPQIVHNMEKTISMGHKICIWNKNNTCKDINDMILSGMHKDELERMINNRTYVDLQAKLEFEVWKKL